MKPGTVQVNPASEVGSKFKGRATITAVITRADGTIEDLGVIADSGPRSFFPRLLWRIRNSFKRRP
jgi:hypothetical protein